MLLRLLGAHGRGKRLPPLSAVNLVEQNKGSRHIEIPEVVMNGLVMPAILAGHRFERDDAIREQVVAAAR